jgi:hypothetical protein
MHQIDQILAILNSDNVYSSKENMEAAFKEIYNIASTYQNRFVTHFINAFEKVKKKKWDKIYVGVDIHETCLEPTWSEELSKDYYPFAKESLQMMSKNKDFCLILWTSSLPEGIQKYLEAFEKDGIHFEYVNKNPECEDTVYADFKAKLYFAIGLDDKFAFLPKKDWEPIFNFLKTI